MSLTISTYSSWPNFGQIEGVGQEQRVSHVLDSQFHSPQSRCRLGKKSLAGISGTEPSKMKNNNNWHGHLCESSLSNDDSKTLQVWSTRK